MINVVFYPNEILKSYLKYFLWSKKDNICLKLFLPDLFNQSSILFDILFCKVLKSPLKHTHTHTHNRMNHLQWVETYNWMFCKSNNAQHGRRRPWTTDQKCKIQTSLKFKMAASDKSYKLRVPYNTPLC